MRFFSFVPFLLAVPATVNACEGDCIVGITNAFLGNYSTPVRAAMTSVAKQISGILHSRPDTQTALGYLQPILQAYQEQSYQGMETAIFPNYFHGKCLDSNGVEPAGCPNPDCPIVCGTPGSLVHFYPKLRYIAFNQTYHLLQALSTPGSDTYKRVEQAVVDAASPGHGERTSKSTSPKMLVPVFLKREQDIKNELKSILTQLRSLLGDACGANGSDETNGLPECSWEQAMKDFILTFP
ncbi:hypothetical protein C8Q79DRAFT_1078055 [Trametes meyenii]|nr:hypothetical protein C8Q79DRAFT_1078055 [Trametes meyenii]